MRYILFDKDLDGVCEYEYLLPIENDDINSILEKLFMNSPFENYFNNNEFLDLFKILVVFNCCATCTTWLSF